ncbi:MAG: transcriptional regulator [Phycisphaeraceae bacterium]|nr:MAG: transcriptional regulator [Phycisphaeraceae bacterium]
MNEQDFKSKMTELLGQINELPPEERPKLEKLAKETQHRHERMKKTLGELQESLDQLRLTVKYLVFDLEATRRENTYLRKLIDSQGND